MTKYHQHHTGASQSMLASTAKNIRSKEAHKTERQQYSVVLAQNHRVKNMQAAFHHVYSDSRHFRPTFKKMLHYQLEIDVLYIAIPKTGSNNFSEITLDHFKCTFSVRIPWL